MKLRNWVLGVAALSMIGTAAIAIADDAPAPTPPAKHEGKAPKLDKPYSLLTDLTDDQKAKIADIHKAELDAVKALQEKEKADTLAVLTPDQQKELTEALAKTAAENKAEAEARRAKMAEEKATEAKNKADNMTTTAPSEAK